jgi:multidrug efflux pump subunit AcrA (membrane-fusion protein)
MPAIVQAKPDVAPFVVRMLVQASSLPNKRELLKEFDKGPDPAMLQAQAQAQQLQQMMQQLQMQLAQTRIALQQAQAQKTSAEAQAVSVKTQAQAASDLSRADLNRAEAAKTAVETQTMPQEARAGLTNDAIETALKVDKHRRDAMPKLEIIAKGVNLDATSPVLQTTPPGWPR